MPKKELSNESTEPPLSMVNRAVDFIVHLLGYCPGLPSNTTAALCYRTAGIVLLPFDLPDHGSINVRDNGSHS